MTGAGGDFIRNELAQWWRTMGLPPVAQLTEPQARNVLAEIDRLTWSERPFDPETL